MYLWIAKTFRLITNWRSQKRRAWGQSYGSAVLGTAFEHKQVKTHLGLDKFWSQDISRRGFTSNTYSKYPSNSIGTMG